MNEMNTKPRRIDINLTAAYLRAIQQEIETADKSIADLMAMELDWSSLEKDIRNQDEQIHLLNEALDRTTIDRDYYKVTNQELVNEITKQKSAYAELLKENTYLKNQSPSAEWHPTTETPDGDQRAIVRTEEGATFMYEPINGKWPKWVVKWMYIPQ